MKKLNLNEAPKTVAFTFGRFNPKKYYSIKV